jgi:P4 family phage/plasmid primase-like protien
MTLRIPALDRDIDRIRAAIAYAEAGWYIIPVAADTKAPTVLGKDWPSKSSRDPQEIASWFAGTDHGIGLHVGRSGGVVFDVDSWEDFPEEFRPLLAEAPFQSTRDNDPHRGHYVFEVPEGRVLGNGRGELPKAFGEVRGLNGIIVVQPTEHVKEHGRYQWLRIGNVPVLPKDLDAVLPEGKTAESAVSDDMVKAFVAEHARAEKPALLKAVLQRFARDCESGSRHEALVEALPWAMRDARLGFYPAKTAIDALWTDFEALMQGETGRWPRSEFNGVLAWAVAQALAEDVDNHREEVQTRLAERDARQAADVQTTAPSSFTAPTAPGDEDWVPPRQPWAYFAADGLDVDLLAGDVLKMGPLRWGMDGAFWSYANGVWSPDGGAVQRRVGQLLKGRFRMSHASNVSAYLQHQVGEIDCSPVTDYMNFTNGMLDWRTGELHPHAAHYGSTVQFPIAWQPDATCPQFDRFLAQVLHPDFIPLVWEVLGYMLMSGNPLQKAILFYGSGRNGKGTLMRVIEGLLGTRNCSAVDLDALNTNRFASASLFGRIANLAGDIDATYQESTAKFKKLTGGDVIDAEEKHQKSFRFTSWAVPVFSANRIPGSADTSFGYLRRWVPIHFTTRIADDQVDIHLDAKLAAELPGIAARAVLALRTLMKRGVFLMEGEAEVAQAEFAEAVDQVRQWLVERTIPAPGHRETAKAMYDDYKAWAADNNNGRLRAGEFYARMENAGHPRVKSGTNWIENLRITPSGLIQPHAETSIPPGVSLPDDEPPEDA